MPKLLSRIILTILVLLSTATPIHAQTLPWSDIDSSCVYSRDAEVATLIGFFCVLRNMVSLVVPFVGIALFIMLVIGGYKYLLSGGDAKNVENAKSTFTMAIGGVVVLLIGWAVLYFLYQFTGHNLTELVIPRS